MECNHGNVKPYFHMFVNELSGQKNCIYVQNFNGISFIFVAKTK